MNDTPSPLQGPSPSPLRLVKMARRHLSQILEIEQLCFSETWHEVDFLRLIDLPDALCLVALQGGRVIGYSCLWVVIESSELGNLAVHPEFQGQGVGARLLERNLAVCRRRGVIAMFLEVRASNERAITLYEHHGFTRIGLRKRYYSKPTEDAVIMRRDL
ncbi:ribosomal protein S18-alanine N-acetyltransferase [bacterium]|nr:ribosomal protein S18-alanine N-acetyltransferase [bacterium]